MSNRISVIFALLLCITAASAQHLGFDKNDYPGDAALPQLRHQFSWTGYWLNPPPGASSDAWIGKRALLQRARFGFALLYNGKTYAQLQTGDPAALGTQDAIAAATSARREGFPARSIIFLDIEEGGRLLPAQKQYLFAFSDALLAHGFSPGAYCSGIPVPTGPAATITSADDILHSQGGRHLRLWIANDACPPSPGCSADRTLRPSHSGIRSADIWQFSQSPRRPQFTATCSATYTNNLCLAPATHIFLDLNTSARSNPSSPRR